MDGQLPIDIYTRQSHKGDERALSIDGQEAVCRDVLADRDLPLGEVFSDPGRSAWNPKVVRPDWERMMGRLEAGISGGVCIFDLERFARRHEDAMRLHKAAEHGLLILDSESSYDLSTPNGLRDFWNAVNAAAYYSGNLSRKVKRGKKLKASRGEVDARRSFGFAPDGVTVLEDERDLIRAWAARLLDGETQESIIAEANEQGIPTVRGAAWGYTTFRQVMLRERNTGKIVLNGKVVEGVSLPGEPILDEDTHNGLVALYSARRPGRPPSGRYLLTGFADCHCGATLSGRVNLNRGHRRQQYWCRTCMRTFVTAARLDEWAAEWTVRTLADPAHAEAVAEADAEVEALRNALRAELARREATVRKLDGRLARDEITYDRHERITAPHEARIREIAAELEGLKSRPTPVPRGTRALPPDDVRYLRVLEEWNEGTAAVKRDMVERALAGRRIVINPGKGGPFSASRVTVQ